MFHFCRDDGDDYDYDYVVSYINDVIQNYSAMRDCVFYIISERMLMNGK
jgi:hypothetical protein